MRPDGGPVAGLGLVVAGIVHQGHVHPAVPVRIVPGEINLAVQCLAGFQQGACGIIHIARTIIGQDIRTVHVKDGRITPPGILDIIITDRPRSPIGGIAFLVEQGLEGRLGILDDEIGILESDQDDGNPVSALGQGRGPGGSLHLAGRAAHRLRLFALRGGRLGRRTEEPVFAPGDNAPALVGHIMEPFVTVDLDRDDAAVRLGHLDLAGVGGDGGEDMEGAQQEREGGKDSFHGYWMQTMKPVPLPAISQAFPSATRTAWTSNSAAWVAACLTERTIRMVKRSFSAKSTGRPVTWMAV